MIQLKGYRVTEMEMESKVPNETKIQLAHSFKYNVRYKKDENKCVGLLEFSLGDKDEVQPFKIKIGLQAEFVYQDETSKPHIHCESFRMIFPYLRMIITNLTTMCGMPGLFIP